MSSGSLNDVHGCSVPGPVCADECKFIRAGLDSIDFLVPESAGTVYVVCYRTNEAEVVDLVEIVKREFRNIFGIAGPVHGVSGGGNIIIKAGSGHNLIEQVPV